MVFDNVLTKEEADRTIEEFWDEVETLLPNVKRKDTSTWDFYNRIGLNTYGFVGGQPLYRPQVWRNRSSHHVYDAFKLLYELQSGQKIQEPMLAIFDRGSLLRPTKDHAEWKIKPNPHFDLDPWEWTGVKKIVSLESKRENKYNETFSKWLSEGCFVPKVKNFTKLQGVLALSPTSKESGGFEGVCGFHNHIRRWCDDTKPGTKIVDSPELM